MCHVTRIRSRPSYYRNANRITICLAYYKVAKQVCRLPSGTRLSSILLAGKECRARETSSLVGEEFSRRRFAASKIPIILGPIKTSRRRARQKDSRSSVARNTMQFRGESRSFFFRSRVLRRALPLDGCTYIATLRFLFPRIRIKVWNATKKIFSTFFTNLYYFWTREFWYTKEIKLAYFDIFRKKNFYMISCFIIRYNCGEKSRVLSSLPRKLHA